MTGEICAAFAAGFLTAKEAIAIAYYRGLAVSKTPKDGAMVAVGLAVAASKEKIASFGLEGRVHMACSNSPESSTISGDSAAVDLLTIELQNQGIFARRLKTDNKAYHSHHMLSVGHEYEELVSSVYAKRTATETEAPCPKMFSSVTGKLGTRELIDTPGYWRRNLESPVLFNKSLQDLLAGGSCHLIEIGPHSALQQPIKEISNAVQSKEKLVYTPTLVRGRDAERCLLDLCGALFLHQQTVTLNKANRLSSKCKVLHSLPTYRWDHKTLLWNEPRISTSFRGREHVHHDLLGSRVLGTAEQSSQWRTILRVKEVPWLADHKLGSTTVFPGAGYLALAAEALSQWVKSKGSILPGVKFRQIHILNMLVLQDEKNGVEIFTELKPAQISGANVSKKWWRFEITSLAADISTTHANGFIATHDGEIIASNPKLSISMDSVEEQATRTWYNRLAKEGLRFGPTFQALKRIQNDRAQKLSQTVSETHLLRGGAIGEELQSEYLIHPITLDAMLQTGIIASAAGLIPRLHGKVPVTIESAEIVASATITSSDICTIHAHSENVGFGTIKFDTALQSPAGQIIARVDGVRAITYDENRLQTNTAEDERNPVLRVLWKPDISLLTNDNAAFLTAYTDRFAHSLGNESDLGRFAGAVDLLTHWSARLRILELGNLDDDASGVLLHLLHSETPLRRYRSYTRARVTYDGKLVGHEIHHAAGVEADGAQEHDVEIQSDAVFDAVIIPPVSLSRML